MRAAVCTWLVSWPTCAGTRPAFGPDAAQIVRLDDHKVAAGSGPQADRAQFMEYVQRNLALNRLRTDLEPTVAAAAAYTRNALAEALRRSPYQVNLLLGGVDSTAGPELYWIDYLGSMANQKYAAQGYAAYFITSTLDRAYKEGMSEDEVLEVLAKCIQQLNVRFMLSQPKWIVKVVDADGIRVVELPTSVDAAVAAVGAPKGSQQEAAADGAARFNASQARTA